MPNPSTIARDETTEPNGTNPTVPQADVAELICDALFDNAPYGVLSADPPWQFNNNGLRDSSNTHYGELTLDALKSLASVVRMITKPDAVLLLWAVPSMVPEALELVKAWGFEYVTMLPWVKLTRSSVEDFNQKLQTYQIDLHDPDYDGSFADDSKAMPQEFWDAAAHVSPDYLRPAYGMGWWMRGCSEPLIIAKRGNPRGLEGYKAGHYLGLLSENFGHSRKPDNVYQLGEQFPGPRLELFARRTWPGWVATGLDTDGRDVRDWLHDPRLNIPAAELSPPLEAAD